MGSHKYTGRWAGKIVGYARFAYKTVNGIHDLARLRVKGDGGGLPQRTPYSRVGVSVDLDAVGATHATEEGDGMRLAVVNWEGYVAHKACAGVASDGSLSGSDINHDRFLVDIRCLRMLPEYAAHVFFRVRSEGLFPCLFDDLEDQ